MGLEMSLLFGRDCKLGYGFDEDLNYIMPFECTPQNVREGRYDTKWLNVYWLSDQDILKWSRLGLLLSDSYLKYLEHQIVFDQNKYYLIEIRVTTKTEECDGCDKYPDNVPRYVSRIDYGMELWVVIDKNGLPDDQLEAHIFLKNVLDKESHHSGRTQLTEQEKQLKCRVLINCKETREMTLGRVFEFADEFERGQHRKYECAVSADLKTNDGNVSIFANPYEFCHFFENVYRAYRKMQLILDKEGFPPVPEMPREQDTFDNICKLAKSSTSELEALIENLETTNDDTLIPKIYLVVKRLVQLNKQFVKNAFVNRVDIGDEYFFEGLTLQPLMRKINTWKPTGLITSNQFKKTEQILRQTHKWKDITVSEDLSAAEPLLKIPNQQIDLFGFVDMTGAVASKSTDSSKFPILEIICPRSCTDDVRKWICTNCLEFVKISTTGGLSMACKCGSKPYGENLLTCVHPEHEESIKIDALPEDLKRIVKRLIKSKQT